MMGTIGTWVVIAAGAGAVTAAVLAIGIWWRGYIGAIIWNWFMPDLFGLPVLTTWQMAAVLLVVTFARPDFNHADADNDKNAWTVAYTILFPLVALGVGYVLKYWVM